VLSKAFTAALADPKMQGARIADLGGTPMADVCRPSFGKAGSADETEKMGRGGEVRRACRWSDRPCA